MSASEQHGTAVRRNTGLFIAGETLWGFQTALVGAATVMTVLLREHGATETMIGAISSIDAFGLLLPQTLGLFLFASQRTRKRDIVIWHFVGIIPWLFAIGSLAALAPRMAMHVVAWGVLMCYGLYVSGIGVVAGVWTDWIAHLFPVRWRGRAMGWSWGASSLAAAWRRWDGWRDICVSRALAVRREGQHKNGTGRQKTGAAHPSGEWCMMTFLFPRLLPPSFGYTLPIILVAV